MSSHRHLAPEHHEGNARCPCTPPEHDPEHKARSALLGSGRRSTPSTGRMIVLPSLALGEHRADATRAWVYKALVLPRPLLSPLCRSPDTNDLDVETPRYTLRMGSAHGLAGLDLVLHFLFSFLLGFGGRREGGYYYTGAGTAPWGFVCFSLRGCERGLGLDCTSLYPISPSASFSSLSLRPAGMLVLKGLVVGFLWALCIHSLDRCNHNERNISDVLGVLGRCFGIVG